jgi:mRNA interferase MazF
VEIEPFARNGLAKKSIADCLQTRPVDYSFRLVDIRGEVELEVLLKVVVGCVNHAR